MMTGAKHSRIAPQNDAKELISLSWARDGLAYPEDSDILTMTFVQCHAIISHLSERDIGSVPNSRRTQTHTRVIALVSSNNSNESLATYDDFAFTFAKKTQEIHQRVSLQNLVDIVDAKLYFKNVQ
jgi:hypothetical protein